MNLIWILILLIIVQPAISKNMLDASRKRKLLQIETQRKSRVILLMHRQESMSFLGFPIARYININDSEEILRALDMTEPDTPIDLVLHTPGGLVLAATQIARAIHHRQGTVRAIVPHFAMSGGTLIAMACDEVIMSRHAVLGPVDPQLGQHPAASILHAVRNKPIDKVDDETLILADQAEKAISQIRQTVNELLADKYSPERAADLAKLMSDGHWTHDRPITFQELKDAGHPVSENFPREFHELMSLYPQPVHSSSVVYLERGRV